MTCKEAHDQATLDGVERHLAHLQAKLSDVHKEIAVLVERLETNRKAEDLLRDAIGINESTIRVLKCRELRKLLVQDGMME